MKIDPREGLRNVEFLLKNGQPETAKRLLAKIEMLLPKEGRSAKKRREARELRKKLMEK